MKELNFNNNAGRQQNDQPTKHKVLTEAEIPSELDFKITHIRYERWKQSYVTKFGKEPQVTIQEWMDKWVASGKYFERRDPSTDESLWKMGIIDKDADVFTIDNFKVMPTQTQYFREGTPVVNDIISDAYVTEEIY